MRENSSMESPWEAAGSDATDWSARYRAGDTPWDHGEAHPELMQWLSQNTFPSGEVLVPGCGQGYDARAIAAKGIPVWGVDISPEAIRLAQCVDSSVHFQLGDILAPPVEWTSRFSGAFEHTCYCAIPPTRRPDYARSLATLLHPGGLFLACFYMTPDSDGEGPPFPARREELDALFGPHFQLLREWMPTLTYLGREGRELFREYVRCE